MKKAGLVSKATVTPFLALLLFACGGGKQPQMMGENQSVLVKLETLQTSPQQDYSEFVGNLEAEAFVTLRTETDGIVQEIFVSEGSQVNPGTPIMALRADKGEASVAGAIANVNVAASAKLNAQAQLNAVKAERGEVVAELQLQQQQFKRISSLVEEGAIPEQDLDQVARDLEIATARLQTLEERIRASEASLQQSEAALQQAEAAARLSQEELQDKLVKAPITGVVGDRLVKVGDYVEIGDALTTITQNQTLNLNLSIPIEKGPQLSLGQPVQIINPTTGTPILTGKISFISPEVSSNSQAILAKASFPNAELSLRSGQFVQARVIWNQDQGVFVPTNAIARIGGETFVFVAENQENSEELIARQTRVQLGYLEGNNYQVLTGLKPGEQVVVAGIQNLSDGSLITVMSH